MLAVARPPSQEMLEADPSLTRLLFWGELLRFPVFGSLGVFAVGIVLTIVFDLSWLYLVIGGALAWLLFARLAVKVWRDLHLGDLEWRLEHGSQREKTCSPSPSAPSGTGPTRCPTKSPTPSS